MNLLWVGISHHTASVEVRETMWLSEEETREAVRRLREQTFREMMLVSTCNRTELYGLPQDPALDDASVRRFLVDFKKSGIVQPGHFDSAGGMTAVEHLFRVASGADSLVIGDIQILNQVKEAFVLSRELDALGPVMNRLMQSTLHVGKRVRTETAICEGAVSVSYAAVELASKIFADLAKKSALLIGAGETGELTLKHLVGKGVGQIRIANRTREKADALAREFGGAAIDFSSLLDALRSVDIVVTSVAAPHYILGPEELTRVMKQRSNSPLFIIDIGVPRNVDPSARKIDNVFLYDIDSLTTIVDRNVDRRKAELPKVDRIIGEEAAAFAHWHDSLQVAPTIAELRDLLESIRAQEVEKNINRFAPADRELIDLVTKRIVNKILHQPMTVLKQGTGSPEAGTETMLRIAALRDLFGIARNGTPPND
jgi:glutamyl-tRNA reductase